MGSEKQIATLIAKLSLDSGEFNAGMEKVKKSMQLGEAVQTTGKAFAAVGAAATAAAGLTAKAAIDFESSFAGVKKTVEAPPGKDANQFFQGLENDIRNMAKEVPASVNEIASVYEAAGQLGISSENLTTFSRAMIDLGNATNLTSEEAAGTLARFANITGMSQDSFGNLGSSIVALGNNMATTEKDIVDISQNIAAAGNIAGLTEADILGWGAAMSSMGVEAASGGTAFSTVLRDMTQSVNSGSGHIAQFAKASGMSVQDFSKLFKDDANAAVLSFVQGLNKMDTKGFYKTLDDLGIGESRQIDLLSRLRGNTDLVSKALGISSEAWKENTALSKEATQRYETTASQMAIMKNQLMDIGITIGQALLPSIKSLLDQITPVIQRFGDWAKQNPELITGLLKAGMAIGAIGIAMLSVMKVISTIKTIGSVFKAFGSLGTVFKSIGGLAATAGKAISGLLTAMGPVGWVIMGIIAVVALLGAAWKNNWFGMRDTLTEFWQGTLVPFFNKVGDWFAGAGEWLGQAWSNTIAFFSKIGDAIGGFFGKVGALFSQVFSKIGEFFSGFGKIFSDAFSGIGAWISNAFSGIGEAIGSAFNSVIDWFKSAPAKIGEAIGGWWEGVKGSFQSFKESFLADVEQFDLKTAISNLAAKIGEGISTWWSGVVTQVETFKQSIVDWFGGIDLSETVKNLASKISDGISGWWSFVTEAIESFKKSLTDWFSQIGLTDTVKNLASKISDGISGWWTFVTEAVENFKKSLTDWFGGIDLSKTVKDLATKIGEGIGGWWEGVKITLDLFLENIKSAIGNIDLLEAAKKMIENFKNGISDAWESFKEWFSEKINGLFDIKLPDWLTNPFGKKDKQTVTADTTQEEMKTIEITDITAISPFSAIPQSVIDSYSALNEKIALLNGNVTTLNSLLGNGENGLAFTLSGLDLYIGSTLTTTLTTFAAFIGTGGVLGLAIVALTALFSSEANPTGALLQVLRSIGNFVTLDLTTAFTNFALFIGIAGAFGLAVQTLIGMFYLEGSETSLYAALTEVIDYLAGDVTTKFTDFDTKITTSWIPTYKSLIKVLWTDPNSVYNAYGAIFGVLEDIYEEMSFIVERIKSELIPAFKATVEPAGDFEGAITAAASVCEGMESSAYAAAQAIWGLIAALSALDSYESPGMNPRAGGGSSRAKEALAGGGPVSRGETYLVGERGPELFSPTRSGWIIPNDEVFANGKGSGKVINIEIHDIYGDANLEQRISNGVQRGLKQAEFLGVA